MKWTIYKVTNLIDNKKYIGITKNKLRERLQGHLQSWKDRKTKRPSYLGLAIKKHGRENFTMEAIDYADSLEEALAKETAFIASYDSLAKNGMGYNIIEDSVSGETTIESIAKRAETHLKAKKEDFAKNKISTKFIGVFFSQERQRWSWSMTINKKHLISKNFSTDEDAALDRDISLTEYYTEKICLQMMNFPEKYQDIIDGKIDRPEKEMKISLKKAKLNFVSYDKKQSLWRARVTLKGKTLAMRSGFLSEEDAGIVADYFNLQTLKNESFLNFPEKKEYYLSGDFKFPTTLLHAKRKIPYQNITSETRNGKTYYRIFIQHKGQKHRDHCCSLEAAIKRRDELRAQYGLQPAIDFPELLSQKENFVCR